MKKKRFQLGQTGPIFGNVRTICYCYGITLFLIHICTFFAENYRLYFFQFSIHAWWKWSQTYNFLFILWIYLKYFLSFRFAVSLSYYGIAFSIPNLSGDRYFNFMIGGGIELAAYILAFVVINSFGRKFPLMIYLQLSGVLCVSVVCIKDFMPCKW